MLTSNLNDPPWGRRIVHIQIVDISRERESKEVISLPQAAKLLVVNACSKRKLSTNKKILIIII